MSYLTPMENLYSFFDVDDKLRCNNLLYERRDSVNIEHITMFMKSNIFRYLCDNVFPHISCHMESLKINADFVGSCIVYHLPSTVFSNISSLHVHSLQEKDLIYIFEHATQLIDLTLIDITERSINLIFQQYFHRLRSFTCDTSLSSQMRLSSDYYMLSTFSIYLKQLSDLLLFTIHMPQLKHLKIHLYDECKDVQAERLRLLEMIKSLETKNSMVNIQSFKFIARINSPPWSIFVRLVRVMIRIRTLFFDYVVTWASSPDDLYRYKEIDDEKWNSSAADYLTNALQVLNQLIHVSFRLFIIDCFEKPNENRWKSCFWPRTKWSFDPLSKMSFFYTLPWPKQCSYNLQLYDEIDRINSDHSIKRSIIIPDQHEDNIGEFARLSRCFPKVQDLGIQAWCSTSLSLFEDIPQPLMYCWCLSTTLSISGIYLSRILPYLPKLRVVTIFGGIDQLTALAQFRSSTLIQLNVLRWIDESVDILHETSFPNVQFLSINLYQETTTGEIKRLERTIEQSFTHLPNLISLHYTSLMTNHDFTQTLQPNQYSSFFNVHLEKTRIVIWK